MFVETMAPLRALKLIDFQSEVEDDAALVLPPGDLDRAHLEMRIAHDVLGARGASDH